MTKSINKDFKFKNNILFLFLIVTVFLARQGYMYSFDTCNKFKLNSNKIV